MLAVPPVIPTENVAFVTRKPYVGFGTSTKAGYLVSDSVDSADAALTPERSPPGALVVSTSTTDEPSVCGGGVLVALGVLLRDVDRVGVPDTVDDRDGVGIGVSAADGDAETLSERDAPADGVCVSVIGGVCVCVGVGPAEGVIDRDIDLVFDGVGEGDGVREGERDSVGDREGVIVGDDESDGGGPVDGVGDAETAGAVITRTLLLTPSAMYRRPHAKAMPDGAL